jgi:tRNA pseudouridine55 synthase
MQDLHPYQQGKMLLIDKPYGVTSFAVVSHIRWRLNKLLGIKKLKVGHAGTLDPLATGLLLIFTGKKTKEIDQFMGLDKVYTGSIKLGATTPCYDREKPEENHCVVPDFSLQDVEQIASKLTGTIQQYPPIFSAIKVDGKKMYTQARDGQEVEIKSREVHIHSFEITALELPFVHFRIHCSKGTYIRSMAHDFGKIAGCGGYLFSLRRESIGAYSVENAVDKLEDYSLDFRASVFPAL